jgi:hypothetical protein
MPERRYIAHLRDDHRHNATAVPGADDAMEAAILFLESHLPEDASQDDGVSVIVEDCETGVEQCFTVHLDEGEARPC